MKKTSEKIATRKVIQSRFFKTFARFHFAFMRELVAVYKQRGQFPLFPTFIANYYEDEKDKEFSVIATLCLDWKKKNILYQVKALCNVMGKHPYEWFCKRGFVHLSTGRKQKKKLMDSAGRMYWKMAKFFSMLYDLSDGRDMKKTFPAGKTCTQRTKLVNFAAEVGETFGWTDCEYKAEVIELVMRASDGFSLGLWATERSQVRCPCNSHVRSAMSVWFPDYNQRSWDFMEAVELFDIEHGYDFFYFFLAWNEVKKANTEECVLYSTRYINRYKKGIILPPSSWIGSHQRMPEIRFND